MTFKLVGSSQYDLLDEAARHQRAGSSRRAGRGAALTLAPGRSRWVEGIPARLVPQRQTLLVQQTDASCHRLIRIISTIEQPLLTTIVRHTKNIPDNQTTAFFPLSLTLLPSVASMHDAQQSLHPRLHLAAWRSRCCCAWSCMPAASNHLVTLPLAA